MEYVIDNSFVSAVAIVGTTVENNDSIVTVKTKVLIIFERIASIFKPLW